MNEKSLYIFLGVVVLSLAVLWVLAGLQSCTTTGGTSVGELEEYRAELATERARIVELEGRVAELGEGNRKLSESLDRASATIKGANEILERVDQIQGSMAEKLRKSIEILQEIVDYFKGSRNVVVDSGR